MSDLVEGFDAQHWHESYRMLADAVQEHLERFIHPDDVAEEALLIDAVERVAVDARGVPGEWKCDECAFGLSTRTLHTADGTVSVRSVVEAPVCPNDGTTLRSLTWRELAESQRDGIERLTELLTRANVERDAEALLGQHRELQRRYDALIAHLTDRAAMRAPAPIVFCSDCPKARATIHQFSHPNKFVPLGEEEISPDAAT